MIVDTTNKKEQPLTQDEIAQYLLTMVSFISGTTEKKKAAIGSTTAASLDPLGIAKVAEG